MFNNNNNKEIECCIKIQRMSNGSHDHPSALRNTAWAEFLLYSLTLDLNTL